MNRKERRAHNSMMKEYPVDLQRVPSKDWPMQDDGTRFDVWVSRTFLVQLFDEQDNAIRMTVNRVTRTTGSWDEKISWDQLQNIKRDIGYGDYYAIEVYPRDEDIVNVANMRHLWILAEPLNIGWFRGGDVKLIKQIEGIE